MQQLFLLFIIYAWLIRKPNNFFLRECTVTS